MTRGGRVPARETPTRRPHLVDEGKVAEDGGLILFLLQLQLLVQFHRQLRLLGLRTARRSTPRTRNQNQAQAPPAPYQSSLQHVDGSCPLLQLQLDSHFGVAELGRGGGGGGSRSKSRSRCGSRNRSRSGSRNRSGDSSLLNTNQLLL